MTDLQHLIYGNFVVVNLGAASDADCNLPDSILKTMTLVELDARGEFTTNEKYYAKFGIKSVIAPEDGARTFYVNNYQYASSLLKEDRSICKKYGIEWMFEPFTSIESQCTSINTILAERKIDHVDVLKLDLEGCDLGVLKSMELLDTVLCVQCEVRFEPMFIGEPHFHEVAEYMYSRGFILMDLVDIGRWRPNPGTKFVDGRITMADAIFMRNPECSKLFCETQKQSRAAKQILASVMMNHKNYASYLLSLSDFPGRIKRELADIINSKPKLKECFLVSMAKYLLWRYGKWAIAPLLNRQRNDAPYQVESFTFPGYK